MDQPFEPITFALLSLYRKVEDADLLNEIEDSIRDLVRSYEQEQVELKASLKQLRYQYRELKRENTKLQLESRQCLDK